MGILAAFSISVAVGAFCILLIRSTAALGLKVLCGLLLAVVIVAPIGSLALFLLASAYFYKWHYLPTVLREVVEVMTSHAARLPLAFVSGTLVGAIGASKFRRKDRPTASFILAALTALVFALSGNGAAAGSFPGRLEQADASALGALLSANQIVFVQVAPEKVEAICWCGIKLPKERMSPWLRMAVVAVEDQRFFDHHGADPKGLLRAIWNRFSRGTKEGGSTITQQLAKNVALTSERAIGRKLDEVRIARRIEDLFSKEDILTAYLNQVPFGSEKGFPIIGAEQAARHFFGRRASELNLIEAATLAGMLRGPSLYDPFRNPERARARAQTVLRLMKEQGRITEQQFRQGIRPSRARGPLEMLRPHVGSYIQWTLAEVRADFADFRMAPGGRIVVTLDLEEQTARHRRLATLPWPSSMESAQLGYVRMKSDGAVTAMIGQRRAGTATMNFASQAKRPIASTFKPFIYAQALQERRVMPSEVLSRALATSDNELPRSLIARIDPQRSAQFMVGLGVKSTLRADGSMALGTSEMPLVELVGAYAALNAGGSPIRPHGYVHLVQDGNIWTRVPPAGPMALSNENVLEIRRMLRKVVTMGTGRAAVRVPNASGKTGTSDGNRDGWFIGFVDDRVSGVWIGHPANLEVPGLTGGFASGIWSRFESD